MDFIKNRSNTKTPLSMGSNANPIIDKNDNNYNHKNDQIIKIILEENQILKKAIAQKLPNEATLASLIDLLEIQRSKIDNLEQENMHLTRLNEELLENLKNMQMKISYISNQNNKNTSLNYNVLNNNHQKVLREENGIEVKNANKDLNYNNANIMGSQGGKEFSVGDYSGNMYNKNFDGYNKLNIDNPNYNDGNKFDSNHYHAGSREYGMPNNNRNQGDSRVRDNGNHMVYSNHKNNVSMGANDFMYQNNGYLGDVSEKDKYTPKKNSLNPISRSNNQMSMPYN